MKGTSSSFRVANKRVIYSIIQCVFSEGHLRFIFNIKSTIESVIVCRLKSSPCFVTEVFGLIIFYLHSLWGHKMYDSVKTGILRTDRVMS